MASPVDFIFPGAKLLLFTSCGIYRMKIRVLLWHIPPQLALDGKNLLAYGNPKHTFKASVDVRHVVRFSNKRHRP